MWSAAASLRLQTVWHQQCQWQEKCACIMLLDHHEESQILPEQLPIAGMWFLLFAVATMGDRSWQKGQRRVLVQGSPNIYPSSRGKIQAMDEHHLCTAWRLGKDPSEPRTNSATVSDGLRTSICLFCLSNILLLLILTPVSHTKISRATVDQTHENRPK